MAGVLAIGCLGLTEKDQLLLRALVRVLGNSLGNGLDFRDSIPQCNVVFAPLCELPGLPEPCVVVRLVGQEGASLDPAAFPGDLLLVAPLRMSNVLAALQSAAQRLYQSQASADPRAALATLLDIACDGLRRGERRRSVVPLGAAGPLVLDFTGCRLHTFLPLDDLLTGYYRVGTPHRVTPTEEELVRAAPVHDLRAVLWRLVAALAQEDSPGDSPLASSPRERYRLLRWPEAAGLAVPGHPRLAALLTSRSLCADQAATAAGLDITRVQRFLQACLALGLARHEPEIPAPAAALPTAGEVTAGSPSSVAPGWLGLLRERLKLW